MAWGGRAQAAATTRASSGVRRTSPPDKGTGEPANYGPGRRAASPPGSVNRDRRLPGLALACGAEHRHPGGAGPNQRKRAPAERMELDPRAVGREPRHGPVRQEITHRVAQLDTEVQEIGRAHV